MATPLALLGIGVSIAIAGASAKRGRQAASAAEEAQEQQDLAQVAQWKQDVLTWEHDITQTRHQMGADVGDIERIGKQFQRGQRATMGASGAELGSGTPLMSMIETQAGIGRDITRIKATAGMKISYLEDLIKEKKKLITEYEE